MNTQLVRAACLLLAAATLPAAARAQGSPAQGPAAASTTTTARGADLPAGFVVGAEDVVSVVFWHDKDLSADVVVRPDGMISLPLLKDVPAAGYTPEQLAGVIEKAAARYVTEPEVTVIVKTINSRKVSVLGEVNKQGTVALTREMNVLQLLAEAGGLLEYADRENITIIRTVNGKEQRFRFNYDDVIRGRQLQQNILLQPGDVVVVPGS